MKFSLGTLGSYALCTKDRILVRLEAWERFSVEKMHFDSFLTMITLKWPPDTNVP
jgi:hypothetical protein